MSALQRKNGTPKDSVDFFWSGKRDSNSHGAAYYELNRKFPLDASGVPFFWAGGAARHRPVGWRVSSHWFSPCRSDKFELRFSSWIDDGVGWWARVGMKWIE